MKRILIILFFHAYNVFAAPQLFATGNQGSNLKVNCDLKQGPDGRYKADCRGVSKELVTLRSEHILWLQGPDGKGSIIDIVVPNYNVQELIKAGFKSGASGNTKVNVLLRKPQQSYDAQVAPRPDEQSPPQVQLQYEPIEKLLVHYPNDRPYSPLRGPLLPPANSQGRPSGARQFQIDPRSRSFPQ